MTHIDRIMEKVKELPPFPAVIHKVFAVLADPLTSVSDILEVVRYDQSITATVIRMCNSAMIGGSQPVSSLKEALVRIGNQSLLRVILSSGGSDVLKREVPGYSLGRGELWRHSVLCALLAESLCEVVRWERRDKAFTAGLLHDIGKVVLSEYVGKDLGAIHATAAAGGTSFVEGERLVLGIGHAEVGARIGQAWSFDDELVAAIRFHHAPAEGGGDLAFLVHLSDALCMTSGMGGGADGLRYNVDYDLMKSHGIGAKEFELALVQVSEVLQRFHGIVAMFD